MDNIEKQQNEKETLDNIDVDDGLYTGGEEGNKEVASVSTPEQVVVDPKYLIKTKQPLKIGIRGTLVSAIIFTFMIFGAFRLIPMNWGVFMFLLYTFLVLLSYSVSLMITGEIYHFYYYSQAKHKSRKTGNNKYAPFLWALIPTMLVVIMLSWNGIISWMNLSDKIMFLVYAIIILLSYSVSLMITKGIYYFYSQVKRKPRKTNKNKYMLFLLAIIPAIPLGVLFYYIMEFIFVVMFWR